MCCRDWRVISNFYYVWNDIQSIELFIQLGFGFFSILLQEAWSEENTVHQYSTTISANMMNGWICKCNYKWYMHNVVWLAQLIIPSFRLDTALLKLSYFLVVFLPTLLDRLLPLHIKHVVERDVGVLADCGGTDVGVWGVPSSLIRFLGELAVCEHRK